MRLPAEWEEQSGVQLTWPHAATDWADMLPDVERVYIEMAREIAKRERLIIVTPEPERVKETIPDVEAIYVACPTNDTWARDHGFVTLTDKGGNARLLDFTFNGWGMKFAANLDNRVNHHIYINKVLRGEYENNLDYVLEGGSIESDGEGTILTTSECLLSPNRNEWLNRTQVELELKRRLHACRVIWLEHGYLAGDDTDSHIDTLARLCPDKTIAYVQCTDTTDEHYAELSAMEQELKALEGYRLVPLPMPDAVYDEDGQRLPATYANFLIVNGAVLMPTYNQAANDKAAAEQLRKAFPNREVAGIDCLPLIRQHGSLHCCTMQFPKNVII